MILEALTIPKVTFKLFVEVNWTKLDLGVANDFKVDVYHVCRVRQCFAEEGVVLHKDTSNCGPGSLNYNVEYCKVPDEMLPQNLSWEHSLRRIITKQRLQNWLSAMADVIISGATCKCYLNKLSLPWCCAKPTKRTVSEYRTKVLHILSMLTSI